MQPYLKPVSILSIPILLIWEYIAKKTLSNVKPSYALDYVATLTMDLFFSIGTVLAKISSFYTYIDFKDVKETLHDFFKPIINIIGSPLQMIYGYIDTSMIYEHPYLVGFGTLTLLSIIVLAWRRYYYR